MRGNSRAAVSGSRLPLDRVLPPLPYSGGMIWEPSRAFIEQTNVWRFMRRLGFYGSRELSALLARGSRAILGRDDARDGRRVVRALPAASWTPAAARSGRNGLSAAGSTSRTIASTAGPIPAASPASGKAKTATRAASRSRELRAEANRWRRACCASACERGDRVALCMPMVPEILSILYGCFKAGMTVVPIFAGFGSGAIATRLEDSGARVLFTADHLERRGKRIPAGREDARRRRAHHRAALSRRRRGRRDRLA